MKQSGQILLTFNKNYFGLTIFIFAIEVLIALFARDHFIRPYFGDVLVVILIYCFVRSFLRLPITTTAIAVLVFSFTIEFLQYLNIIEKLRLEKSTIARIVLGASFEWTDLLAYLIGMMIVFIAEKYFLKKDLRTWNISLTRNPL